MKTHKTYIGYCSSSNRWLNRIFKPPFQHVLIVQIRQYSGYNVIEIHDWIKGCTKYKSYPVNNVPEALYFVDDVFTEMQKTYILQEIDHPDILDIRRKRRVFSCVQNVKRKLGIKAIEVQTPNELFEYIRDHKDGKVLV